MPIYVRTYRTFEGRVRRRFRWVVVAKQELSILFKSRVFQGLVLLAYLHVMLRLLQIMTVDMLPGSQRNPAVMALQRLSAFNIDGAMFFDFLRIQTPLVFLIMIYAGSAMICDDFRNNLVEIYFSKPLTWRDYVIGKITSLAAVGLILTVLPGIALCLMHLALSPTIETLRAVYWVPASIVAFGLIIVVPCTLGILASSAMFNSRRYTSIGIFMITFGDLAVGRAMPELMHDPTYALLAFPLALNRLGEALFLVRRPLFDLDWRLALVFLVTVCLATLIIICRKARRAEIAG